jgi:hypothetical protein
LATGKELRAFTGAPGVWLFGKRFSAHPTFTPDGTAVLFSTKDSLVARDLQTGLEVPLPGDMKMLPPRIAVFSPDGRTVLTWIVDRDQNGLCEVWDWPGGKKRFSWKVEKVSFEPGFSPDGTAIFNHPTSPEQRDARTGQELPPTWKQKKGSHLETLVSLHSNPRWVLEERYDIKETHILEAGTGKPLSQFRFAREQGGYLLTFEAHTLSPTGGQFASSWNNQPNDIHVFESASCTDRRRLVGHRGEVRVLGFTPDGTKLLTAGGDHTVLVWDMRLASVPLPEALQKVTDTTKLWDMLATGSAKEAYLAMARLARESETALKLVGQKLAPARKGDTETDPGKLADARAIELLEALGTDGSRALLKELAGGHAGAFRTQEAKRAIERSAKP